MNTTVNKTYEYKITAPPRTFRTDIFWWRRSETLIPTLLLVDIFSRKVWAYIKKSKKAKRADVSVSTLKGLKDEVAFVRRLEVADEVSDFRRAGDVNKAYELITEAMKLFGDSAYGKCITNQENLVSTT